MQYIGSLEAAGKHTTAKIFKENRHPSVKILQICMVLQDSVQLSLQNPAKKNCYSAEICKGRKPGVNHSVRLHLNLQIYQVPFWALFPSPPPHFSSPPTLFKENKLNIKDYI